MWEKVRTLVIDLHFLVLFPYNHKDVKVGYRAVSSHLKMEELDSPESLTEENGVRKQTNVVRKKREVRDRKETLCASYMSLYYSILARHECTVCACIYMCCFFLHGTLLSFNLLFFSYGSAQKRNMLLFFV